MVKNTKFLTSGKQRSKELNDILIFKGIIKSSSDFYLKNYSKDIILAED